MSSHLCSSPGFLITPGVRIICNARKKNSAIQAAASIRMGLERAIFCDGRDPAPTLSAPSIPFSLLSMRLWDH